MKKFWNKRILIQKVIAALFFILFIGGCYYDNVSELYPSAGLFVNCDTSASITYSNHVSKILDAYCTNCHGADAPKGGISLDTYNSVKIYVGSGQLPGAIKHETGYTPMPPNTQLDTCLIKEIETWIQAGANNN